MSENPQRGHEQYAEDLALYAVGALEAGSCAQLEQHLRECPACRRELATLRGDASLLALSVSGPAPPQRARERLLAAIASDSKEQERYARAPLFAPRRPWWSFAPAFAALVLAVFAIFLQRENANLRRANEEIVVQLNEAKTQNQHYRDIGALVEAEDAVHVSMVSTNTPMPHANTIYRPKTGQLLLMASNLQPLPAGMTYELWLIPKSGAPMPCGLFKPDAQGSAMMMHMPNKSAGIEAQAFAITMEPEGGSPGPTGEILLKGSG